MNMEERFDKVDKGLEGLKREVLSLAQVVGVTGKAIDDLTQAVAEGFTQTEERFEKIDEKFEKVDLQFEQVNGKIDGVNRRIDAELDRTLQLETRVIKVEEATGLAK